MARAIDAETIDTLKLALGTMGSMAIDLVCVGDDINAATKFWSLVTESDLVVAMTMYDYAKHHVLFKVRFCSSSLDDTLARYIYVQRV